MSENYRWKAEIVYRSQEGLVMNSTFLEELEELDVLVEIGPHWDTIDHIMIYRENRTHPNLTIEQAEDL